jgi:5'-nucleotidase
MSRPEGQLLVGATLNGQPLVDSQTYRLVLNSFIASGGDAYVMFRDAKGKRVDTGFVDLDALIDYFRKNSPIRIEAEGRVKKVGG